LNYFQYSTCRVSGPFLFNADPAFFLIADPDPGFDDQKLKKFKAEKTIYTFLIRTCNLFIPRAPQSTPKLQEKPLALKREHPALQFKT
jgi:hypothetical protein